MRQAIEVLYRSPDRGKTWYSTSAPYMGGVLSMAYEAPGAILAGGSGSGYGGMYRSIDGGKTITKLDNATIKYGKSVNGIAFDGKGWVYTANGYSTSGSLQRSSW
jgi:hypothetical protein